MCALDIYEASAPVHVGLLDSNHAMAYFCIQLAAESRVQMDLEPGHSYTT